MVKNIYTVSESEFPRATSLLVAKEIYNLQKDTQKDINVVFATGNTMVNFLDELANQKNIDWQRIHAFHLDEYSGLPIDHECSFAYFLNKNLFSKVSIPLQNIHYINGESPNISGYIATLRRLGGLDIVLLGIGLNGHLAFNESGSSFECSMREVCLDEKTILANECDYPDIRHNPRAITMGIKEILEGRRIFFFATGKKKAEIVKCALEGQITEDVPASILQRHSNVTFVLDEDAAVLLTIEKKVI